MVTGRPAGAKGGDDSWTRGCPSQGGDDGELAFLRGAMGAADGNQAQEQAADTKRQLGAQRNGKDSATRMQSAIAKTSRDEVRSARRRRTRGRFERPLCGTGPPCLGGRDGVEEDSQAGLGSRGGRRLSWSCTAESGGPRKQFG
jgi:hypothetical protein